MDQYTFEQLKIIREIQEREEAIRRAQSSNPWRGGGLGGAGLFGAGFNEGAAAQQRAYDEHVKANARANYSFNNGEDEPKKPKSKPKPDIDTMKRAEPVKQKRIEG